LHLPAGRQASLRAKDHQLFGNLQSRMSKIKNGSNAGVAVISDL